MVGSLYVEEGIIRTTFYCLFGLASLGKIDQTVFNPTKLEHGIN